MLEAFIGCQHTLSDVLRLAVKIGARPDLSRTDVLTFDEALYVCIDVHLHMDDLCADLLHRIESTALTNALENLVRDGVLRAEMNDVREES